MLRWISCDTFCMGLRWKRTFSWMDKAYRTILAIFQPIFALLYVKCNHSNSTISCRPLEVPWSTRRFNLALSACRAIADLLCTSFARLILSLAKLVHNKYSGLDGILPWCNSIVCFMVQTSGKKACIIICRQKMLTGIDGWIKQEVA